MQIDCEPRWVAAALETEADIKDAPNRALAIDQAAQRRSVGPDVVRRQIRCLEYVRRYGGPKGMRAGMSAVELLITIERMDARHAGAIRRRVLSGEIKIDALKAEVASAKMADTGDLRQPDRDEVLARFQSDLPDFVHLRLLDASADTLADPLVVGADFAGVVEDRPLARRWAWAGIMAPSMSGCHRGGPLRDLVRSVMAASLWADTVSVVVTLSREAEAVTAAMAQARPEDQSRICIHQWHKTGGVWLATSDG